MEIPSGQSPKWLSKPIIATISRLLYQELTVQNEYLRLIAGSLWSVFVPSSLLAIIGFTGIVVSLLLALILPMA